MEVEASLMPLHIRRQLLSDVYLSKTFSHPSHPLHHKTKSLNHVCQNNTYWENRGLPLSILSFQFMVSNKFINLQRMVENFHLNMFKISYKTLVSSINPIFYCD